MSAVQLAAASNIAVYSAVAVYTLALVAFAADLGRRDVRTLRCRWGVA